MFDSGIHLIIDSYEWLMTDTDHQLDINILLLSNLLVFAKIIHI